MTCKMRLKEGSVRIGVPQHIFLYIWPQLEKPKVGGGERGKSIHFWKGLFTGSPKIPKSEPYELQEKSFCGKSLKFDVTYQPQAEMLLLLDLWKELLQISFEAISES